MRTERWCGLCPLQRPDRRRARGGTAATLAQSVAVVVPVLWLRDRRAGTPCRGSRSFADLVRNSSSGLIHQHQGQQDGDEAGREVTSQKEHSKGSNVVSPRGDRVNAGGERPAEEHLGTPNRAIARVTFPNCECAGGPVWGCRRGGAGVLCLWLVSRLTLLVGVFPVMCSGGEAGAGLAPVCWPDQGPVRARGA